LPERVVADLPPEPDVTYDLLGHYVAPPHLQHQTRPPPCSVDDLLRHTPDLPLLDLEVEVSSLCGQFGGGGGT
jgi:hypothetical protein